MTVESATYLSDLNAAYPEAGSTAREGDDHLRLLKSVLLGTFPYIAGPVTATHAELNYTDGVTGPLQDQLNLKAPLASPTFTGTLVAASGSFSGTLSVQTPSLAAHAANKSYVDSVAISAVLPAQTGNARHVIATDGASASWSPLFGVGSVITTSQTAVTRRRYVVDTSGGAFTLTLPASPSADDWVWIVDHGGALASANLTVARNGSLLMGLSEDLLADVNYASVLLIYNATKGWVLS